MSRSVWSKRDRQRGEAPDDATVGVFGLPAAPRGAVDERPFSVIFKKHYRRIRALLNRQREPGLALFVAGPENLEASAWWEAAEGTINPLIVGRHSAAEVFVPSDPLLSLRHLAVMIHPRPFGDAVRFRVVDLRTPTAFEDEEGRLLEAVQANGPLLLRFASLSALFFPTGGPGEAWPEDPEEGWKRVPERVHLDCTSADSASWRDLEGRWPVGDPSRFDPSGGPPTLSASCPGPAFAGRDLAGSDCPRGTLTVRCEQQTVSLRLGESAMKRGLLLGRYERCDDAGVPFLTEQAVSRVHLLLIEMAGGFYAVDTASKHGVWHGRRRIRVIPVSPGLVLGLARDEITVEWHPIH